MSLLLGIAIHLNRHQRYLLIISVLTWHAITQQSTTLRMHAIHIPPFHFTRYSGSGTEIIHIASETTDRPQVYTWQYYLSHFNINQNSYIVLESATLWQESMLMSLPKSLARDHIYMPRQIQPQICRPCDNFSLQKLDIACWESNQRCMCQAKPTQQI